MNEHEAIKELTVKLDRMRIDLMATNLALSAIAAALPPEQLKTVLTKMASASVLKQETFEEAPVPAVKEILKQQLAAEERLYQMLQGAPKYFGRG